MPMSDDAFDALVAQLQNFKTGIRGSHPDDGYGWQMGLMADMLPDDDAIKDVVAYINTLEIKDDQQEDAASSVAMINR